MEEKLRSLIKENMESVTVSWIGPLQSEGDIKQSHVPKKSTTWVLHVWQQWATERFLESVSGFVHIFVN